MAVRREKEEELKGMATLFEMKEYDYFCYVLTDALMAGSQRVWPEGGLRHGFQTALAQIKNDFWANSALFQCAILAYNMDPL